MAAANKTPRHNDTTNQAPHGDDPSENQGVEHNGDRSDAEPAPHILDRRNHISYNTLDMSWIGGDAISDRNRNTTLRTKNRTCGPAWDEHILVLANLDKIIQNPKNLYSTLLDPELFDYLCVKFAERLAELGLHRLFWDDDNRSSDSGTRSKLYIRHAILLSLFHKKTANAECVMGTIFGIDQSTVSRYLKVVNEVLAEILPTSRNLTKIIRDNYARDDTTKGEPAKPKAEMTLQDNPTTAATRTAPERPGPLSTSGPPIPLAASDEPPAATIIGAPVDGKGIPGILAGPTLESCDGQLSTRVSL